MMVEKEAMMSRISRVLPCLLVLVCAAPTVRAADQVDPALQQAIASPSRSERFLARDKVRHPAEELTFFGLRATQTVVEVAPGGGYWTEILAPYLAPQGKLYVATEILRDSTEGDQDLDRLHKKFAADPARFGKVMITGMGVQPSEIAPPGSADLVVTFRNLHNWMNDGSVDVVLADFFRALKPGGILGIEEHRARPDKPQDPKADNGYVREDYAIALAKKAGFELVAKSEINANPKDTADWPKGVWTLPPTLAMGEVDRAKYQAIGEADNFVLKFRKPAS
jgi:predicted methyltransferase